MLKRLLITGAGGDISRSIANIARVERIAAFVVGADASPPTQQSGLYDTMEPLPPAGHPAYICALRGLLADYAPDLIIPGSEAELERLMREDLLESIDGTPVLSANRRSLEVGLDKLATVRHLEDHGITMPWTRIVGLQDPVELPCVVKPRRGQGSKSVGVVHREDLAQIAATRAGDVWQQLLPDDDQEYTCGLYGPAAGPVRSIVFRRRLSGGRTSTAELIDAPHIEALLRRVAAALELRGAVNVQLRLVGATPYIFELNPRFSSTVDFRHHAGFRDFVWSVRERFGMEIDSYDPLRPPLRFRREIDPETGIPGFLSIRQPSSW